MVDPETLKKVILYIRNLGDSETESEVEYALRWVYFGKTNEETPTIIRAALGEFDDDGDDNDEEKDNLT